MKNRRAYVKPTLKELAIDNQTSMILQSPPGDPPVSDGFLKLPF